MNGTEGVLSEKRGRVRVAAHEGRWGLWLMEYKECALCLHYPSLSNNSPLLHHTDITRSPHSHARPFLTYRIRYVIPSYTARPTLQLVLLLAWFSASSDRCHIRSFLGHGGSVLEDSSDPTVVKVDMVFCDGRCDPLFHK